MNMADVSFPMNMQWSQNMSPYDTENLDQLLKDSLIHPLEDFFKSPGKNVRTKLVEIGFLLSHEVEIPMTEEDLTKIELAASIVEAIHGGALIVDDIQDGSVQRRNLPTMHLKYGMPLALNAANWLYFWGLEKIKDLNLESLTKNLLVEKTLSLLSRAHMGQALDIGTTIDELEQKNVYSACLTSMELKTGTLMSLSLIMGGAIAHTGQEKMEELECLGAKLGIALQMFDDLGNIFLEKGGAEKRLEDLRLKRPTWIWAQASLMSQENYRHFLDSVHELPKESTLIHWLEQTNFKAKSISEATRFLTTVVEEWKKNLDETHPKAYQSLKSMAGLLEKAYV